MPFDDEESSLRLSLAPPGAASAVSSVSSAAARTAEAATAAAAAAAASSVLSSGATSSSPRASSSSTNTSSTSFRKQLRVQRSASSLEASAAGKAAITMSKGERIPAPYPWATERRAYVHSLDYLLSCAMTRIRGEVICKRCDGSQMVDVDLKATFMQVNSFFINNRDTMHDRAPKLWTSPRLLDCSLCRQSDCVKPVIHSKKRNINWFFLLLTQTLGLCTLDQLKYFCKHTRRHRTGAKDRVLYLAYVGLLKQLNPAGPYE